MSVFEIKLVDDGTLDTVVSVDECEHRYSQEEGAEYRGPDGAITRLGWQTLRARAEEDHENECC